MITDNEVAAERGEAGGLAARWYGNTAWQRITDVDVQNDQSESVVMLRARPRPAGRTEPGPGLVKPSRARHRALEGPGLGLEECQACQARQARA